MAREPGINALAPREPPVSAPAPARIVAGIALALAGAAAAGCGARTELRACEVEGETRPCSSFCGVGVETCLRGRFQGCSAAAPQAEIPIDGVVRDFSAAHPDFEDALGSDPGIVGPLLGDDDKPIYAGSPTTPTTHGKERFDEWYRDVPGVNQRGAFTILLGRVRDDPPLYRYDDQTFFPVDGDLLGNEGFDHNFHFTFETSVEFRYVGGERFTFTGDDDLWVFINRRLAIDLGGVHSPESKTVDLDASAEELGLTAGDVYTISLFFAERHSTASTFRIDTSIAEFNVCPERGGG